jgi:hypothetical protein
MEHLITASGRCVALWDVTMDKPCKVSEMQLISEDVHGEHKPLQPSFVHNARNLWSVQCLGERLAWQGDAEEEIWVTT